MQGNVILTKIRFCYGNKKKMRGNKKKMRGESDVTSDLRAFYIKL